LEIYLRVEEKKERRERERESKKARDVENI
jgi:hypothetical protein